MASGDFLDLATLAAKAAQRDIGFTYDLSAAKDAINEVLRAVCEDLMWDFLQVQGTQAMTVGQETYTFTTIASSLSVPVVTRVIGVGQPTAASTNFAYVAWEDYWAIKALNPSLGNGIPTLWTTTADANLHVWPKPNATTALTILALKEATELAADADLPVIPAQFRRRLLVPGAAAILLRQDGGAESMQAAEAMEAMFTRAKEEMAAAHKIGVPNPRPTVLPVELPAGLIPTTGSILWMAHNALHQVGLKTWDHYALARARVYVNEGYQLISQMKEDWDFLVYEGQATVTAGSDLYTYTSLATALSLTAVNQIRAIVIDTPGAGDIPLREVSWKALETLAASSQDGDAGATPVMFAQWNGRYRFYPKPDIAYSMGYFVDAIPATQTDTSVPEPQAFWRRVLVPYAAARLAAQSDNPDVLRKAPMFQSEYDKVLQDMRAAQGPQQIELVDPALGVPGRPMDDAWSVGW